MSARDKLRENFKKAKENVPLAQYSSLGVGGEADFLFVANSVSELVEAVVAAKKSGLAYKVIGFGTNVIVSDAGFGGLVIINRTSALNIDASLGRVIAESGVSLSKMILEAAAAGLGGLEPLYGIPGTVGGAISVNAGAHGVSIGDYLRSSSVLISADKILPIKRDWFKFSYRKSRLKYSHLNSPPVVLNAIFQFQRRKEEDILEDIGRFKKERQEKQPIGQRTCGSIFRNPTGSDQLKSEEDKFRTAGYLLDTAGAKQFSSGAARVSKVHANWIINRGNASAKDIRGLIEKMRNAVEEKYSLTLLEEVEYLGDWKNG